MNFAIFYNPTKEAASSTAEKICSFLAEQGMNSYFEEADLIKKGRSLSDIAPDLIDYTICLGGDGSILRVIHRHKEIKAPIIGINMGSLGFLADTPLNELFTSLKSVLDGKFTIQKRIMMDGVTSKNENSFSVNEIVIHRGKNPSLVDLAIFVDNKYLNTFSADGVIFSTATGSTAYSLSAGGPILTPELEAFIITPISPHTITNRPIVLMPKFEIRVEYKSPYAPVEVTFDGFTSFFLATGEHLIIKKSLREFKVVSLFNHDYFATLRTKLHWSGKLIPHS